MKKAQHRHRQHIQHRREAKRRQRATRPRQSRQGPAWLKGDVESQVTYGIKPHRIAPRHHDLPAPRLYVCAGRRSSRLAAMRQGSSSSRRRPATPSNARDMGGYGERKLPTTTPSASEPAAQPNSVAWVMF
jgi:hypothetical protein